MTPAASPHTYFAPCALGVEPALEAELRGLGAAEVQAGKGGVSFRGDDALGYAACLWLRSAVHVLRVVHEGPAKGPDGLYELVRQVDWSRYTDPRRTLAVDASVRDSELTHSMFAALRVKDAIVDQFRERGGERPSVDVQNPDLPLRLRLVRDQATLLVDLAGASLHKRGWRPIQVKSPLNEALAAGLLLLSGWDKASPLVDPMCGSGTFVIEAACMAADRAPGLGRTFAFERWPDLDAVRWRHLRDQARSRARVELPFAMEGADRHGGALDLARKGARAAGVEFLVRFRQADASAYRPSVTPAIVAVNPPWGRRLSGGEELRDSWRALGRFLHERCAGATAWVLSGDAELTRLLGLKAERRIPVRNGPVDCRWLCYRVRGASGAPGT